MTTLSWLLMAIVTAIWIGMLTAVWYAAAVMRARDGVPATERVSRRAGS